MKIDLIPTDAQALAAFLTSALSNPPADLDCAPLRDALAAILDAIDDEAERQHLDRCYPEGGY